MGAHSESDFAATLSATLSTLAGRTPEQLGADGTEELVNTIAAGIRPQLWTLLRAHREMGHRIVLASSALPHRAEPAAREIEADHVLCTRLEVIDGRYTGRLAGRPVWGPGKAAAVRALARTYDIDLVASYAYANGDEEVPVLEAVGHPVAIAPQPDLRAEAKARDWTVLDQISRPQQPAAVTVARTAAYYAAVLGMLGVGTVAALARREPRVLTRDAMPLGNRIGLALSGIEIDIVCGREHLTQSRPCAFVFNHQSKLDAPILLGLLGGDLAGVGKAEIAKVPGVGQFLASAGVVFVERKNSAKAQAAVAPLVAKLRDERVSVVLSPEGTRVPTPRVGAFKTGAFHMAMQAGVPVVPIVIRNAAQLQWRGGVLMNPGTVDVAVLDPLDTADWRQDTVRTHAADVREMFVQTLAHWPTGDRR